MGDKQENLGEDLFSKWLTPAGALNVLTSTGLHRNVAKGQLLQRLQDELIVAAARIVMVAPGKSASLVRIPKEWWVGVGVSDSLWQTADAAFEVKGQGYTTRKINAYEVRLDPEGVGKIASIIGTSVDRDAPAAEPNKAEPAPTSAPMRDVGGRPLKPWWESLWLEMARQLYDGDLKPETKAVIEKAMLDWAATNGHEMGDTTARNAARKLFDVLHPGGKKGR